MKTCSDCFWFDDEDGWCGWHEELVGSDDDICEKGDDENTD